MVVFSFIFDICTCYIRSSWNFFKILRYLKTKRELHPLPPEQTCVCVYVVLKQDWNIDFFKSPSFIPEKETKLQ